MFHYPFPLPLPYSGCSRFAGSFLTNLDNHRTIIDVAENKELFSSPFAARFALSARCRRRSRTMLWLGSQRLAGYRSSRPAEIILTLHVRNASPGSINSIEGGFSPWRTDAFGKSSWWTSGTSMVPAFDTRGGPSGTRLPHSGMAGVSLCHLRCSAGEMISIFGK